jgi:hypothetical protein
MRTSGVMSTKPILPHEKELKALQCLAQTVAHDVNNLLSGILGYCELMKCEAAADGLKPQIEEMWSAGKRIASLIRILLVFSDNYIYRAETLDLNKVLLEIEKLVPRILGPEIRFTTAKAPELWPILADPAKLKLALIALVFDMQYLISNKGNIVFSTGNASDECTTSPDTPPEPRRWVIVTATSSGDLAAGQVQSFRHRLTLPADGLEEAGDCGTFGFSKLVRRIGGRLLSETISDREFRVRMLLPTALS